MRAMQFGGKAVEQANARLFNCLGKETRFVTSEGVKAFTDLKDGEEITVLTHLGNWKQAIVRNYGVQALNTITVGRGKNSFGYIASPLEQANRISVEISSVDDSFSSKEDTTVRYGNSEVIFYENDLELGTLFNKAITNGHFVGDDGEINLTAIPFFVTTDTIASKSLEMVWQVNGLALPIQTIKNKVRLSGESGIGGGVIASIFIKNKTRLFEEGTVGVELDF